MNNTNHHRTDPPDPPGPPRAGSPEPAELDADTLQRDFLTAREMVADVQINQNAWPSPSATPTHRLDADAAVDEYQPYIPGHGDGGRVQRRYASERPHGDSWKENNNTNDTIARLCVGELLKKANHPGMSQSLIKDNFKVTKASIPECPKTLPTNYRQLLTFLEDQGLLVETETVVYDMCSKCYTLYRGDGCDSSTCLNADCACDRKGNTTQVHYR